jgi:uncharacterized protein (TIGR02001 family)
MKTYLKLSLAALVSASALVAPSVALAEGPTAEGNVSLVSDYRFRGVTLSDKSIALQGGLDLSFDSGFYVGTWASSIEPVGSSELELDLYVGYGGELAEGVSFDVGALLYTYPDAADTEYVEFYGSLGTEFGDFGVAYAPEQSNIGDDDNLYVYYSGSSSLGDSDLSVTYGIGYETGAFGDLDGDGDDKIDWSIGLATSGAGLDFGLTYIDTSEDADGANETLVFSVARAF